MNEINTIIDNMFGFNNDFFRCNPFFMTDTSLSTNGFKRIIRKPHDLIEVTDKKGNLIAQRLEVVTTPFTKDDVKVTIKDDILKVQCGSENKKVEENEKVVYRGISSQSYTFSLSIPDTIDKKNITAENKDGILKITMPIKKEEEKKSDEIEIKIN